VYMHNASMCVHVYTVYTSAIFYFVATWPFDPLLLNQLIDYVWAIRRFNEYTGRNFFGKVWAAPASWYFAVPLSLISICRSFRRCLSVCHTVEPRINGSRHRNTRYQNQGPWMTMNGVITAGARYLFLSRWHYFEQQTTFNSSSSSSSSGGDGSGGGGGISNFKVFE